VRQGGFLSVAPNFSWLDELELLPPMQRRVPEENMKILIAEDHEVLRELLEDQLVSWGHTVVSTKDGMEALRAFLNQDVFGAFDYVITDYQMPRMNGVVLITSIRKVTPQQKCILVSGDPPQSSVIPVDAGKFPIVRKPYGKDELFALLT
jgi:CheY-like chemotaxis protein